MVVYPQHPHRFTVDHLGMAMMAIVPGAQAVTKRFGRRRPFLALGGGVLLLAQVLVGGGQGSVNVGPSIFLSNVG